MTEGAALSRRRRGLRTMKQETVVSSGDSSLGNIQELPDPETNVRQEAGVISRCKSGPGKA